MQVEYYTAWEAISIVQFVWFAAALIGGAVVLFHAKQRVSRLLAVWQFFFFFLIFTLCKILGGILGLVVLKSTNYNSGLYAAAYVFDSISLGFLIKCLLTFVEYFYRHRDDRDVMEKIDPPEKLSRFHPFTILTTVLMVSIILSAISAGEKASGGSSSASSLGKAGSLLFLAALIILFLALLHLRSINADSHRLFFHLVVAIVFLLVRVAYAIVVAFKITNFDTVSKFSLLFGDWEYFAFMVLLMEGIVAFLLLWIMSLFVRWFRI